MHPPGYMKDPNTGFIINTNDAEYQKILLARDKKDSESRIARLENDLSEIKTLLLQLVNGTNNG